MTFIRRNVPERRQNEISAIKFFSLKRQIICTAQVTR